MRQVLKLWNDDCGVEIIVELILVLTIVVLGAITGLVALRQAVIVELTELAQALMALNQSFSFSGQTNCESSTAGSSASDTTGSIAEGSVAASTAIINQNACD
jgi:hypothetical protein